MAVLSRRDFIVSSAGAVAVAALGATAFADEVAAEGEEAAVEEEATEEAATEETTEEAAEGEATEEAAEGEEAAAASGSPFGDTETVEDPDWRTAPSADDYTISTTYDCDVLVCGVGYAGSTAFHKAAEGGKVVIGIDSQYEDSFNLYGGDIGTMNSTYQQSIGIPTVEPNEFYTNYQMCCGNRAEPDLLKYYAHNAGTAFDFFTSVSEGIEDTYTTYAWDDIPEEWTMDCGKFQTYPGAVSIKNYGSSQVPLDNINYAVENYGATMYWGHSLVMLLTDDDGAVVGAIAQNLDTEEYVQINTTTAVIVATGDLSANSTMVNELLPEVAETNPTSTVSGSGRDGMGQKAMYWAGGAFEIGPRSGMGGVSGNPMGVWKGSHVCLIDKDGYRYCNEAFAHNFVAGIPSARREAGLASVWGSNFYEPLSRGPIGHLNLDDWSALEEQKEVFTADHEDSGAEGFDYDGTTIYCSDDPLTLAGYLGYEGDAAEQFAESIEHYNEMAAEGVDDDYDKPAECFQAIEPPYFGTYSTAGGGASLMVSFAGMFCDRNGQVRHQETFTPIPGLFAAGNCMGGRFPLQYTSPINGISISWAVTSGYQVGEYVATL